MKLFSALLLAAAPAATQPAVNTRPLAMFDRLVGSCWTTKFSDSASDIHCFSLIYGGAHVRDIHRVVAEGKVVYRGETIYSRDSDHVTYVYVNSLGGVGQGMAIATAEGIQFTLTMRGTSDAKPKEYPTRWRWLSQDAYEVWNEGQWRSFNRGGEPE